MELYECLAAVKRRFWIIGAVALAAALSAWAVSCFLVESVYESTATIIVSKSNETPGENGQELLNSNYIKVYYTLGNSDSVALSIIDHLQLNTTVEKLREQVSIEADYDTGIIKISVDANSAGLARDIAAEFIKCLKEHSNKLSIRTNINIIDEPTLPALPIRPKILLNVLLSAAAGILAGLLLALFFGSKELSSSDMPAMSALPWLPLLGSLPKHKVRRRKRKSILSFPAGCPADESIKIIRTGLGYLFENNQIKSVMITSPRRAEGKTTFALNLAVSMAQLGKRVLVVDCSFRKPGLSKLCDLEKCEKSCFEMEGQPENKCAVSIFSELGIDLASDFAPSREQRGGAGFPPWLRIFLDGAGQRYDLVILDCPSIQPYADTMMMCSLVKNVVLVTEYSRLAASVLDKSVKRLKQVGADTLGVVVNKTPAAKMRHA
ncbi:hypothetical protein SDC9_47361 [bioreactor metagenome]|uniref:Polysaccharide chain length determinant N-terminal domain-containing protein n=1 Tax=bioreactor metagenome TaxID=1076179 RepID=A0A644WF23_9ZZZZ